jgi:hypothetical protein
MHFLSVTGWMNILLVEEVPRNKHEDHRTRSLRISLPGLILNDLYFGVIIISVEYRTQGIQVEGAFMRLPTLNIIRNNMTSVHENASNFMDNISNI